MEWRGAARMASRRALIWALCMLTCGPAALAHPISFCNPFLANLPMESQAQLKAHLQLWQQSGRHARELKELADYKKHPSADERGLLGFAANLTLEALQAEESAASQDRATHEGHAAQMLTQLTQEGKLPQNATLQYASYCLLNSLDRKLYPYNPTISFVLNFFKRPWVIHKIMARLLDATRASGMRAELVVNVDEPSCSEQWAGWAANLSLAHSNLTVVPVFSPNLHEARGYNRAVKLARGQVLVLLQDDDLPPGTGGWMRHLVGLFNKYPHVGAIGMHSFRWCRHGYGQEYQGAQRFRDPDIGVNVNFVHVADFAPLAVRRSAFNAVGGLDEGLSEQGQCGIWSDWELCMRMWADGWQVMHMEVVGRTPDNSGQDSGTHTPDSAEKCWGRQMSVASASYYERWTPGNVAEGYACSLAQALNRRHLQHIEGRACPFKDNQCSPLPAESGEPRAVGGGVHLRGG